MKDGERGLPIENYGRKEQKKLLHNTVTVPDPHPCTARKREEEHNLIIQVPCDGATVTASCPWGVSIIITEYNYL